MNNPAELSVANPGSAMHAPVVVGYCAAGEARLGDRPTMQWRSQPFDVITIARRGAYALQWANQPPVQIDEGAAALIPAFGRRRSHWPAGSQPLICWFHLSVKLAPGAAAAFSHFATPTVLSGAIVSQLLALHARLMAIKRADTEPLRQALLAKSLGLETLALVLPQLQSRQIEHLGAFRRIAALLQILDSEPRTDLSVEAMARQCCLSASRFHRVFLAATGATPKAYHRRRGLEHAAFLLQTTDLTLAQIADQTLFADQFHFSRMFKREFGVPPTVYRQTAPVDFA